MLSAAVIMRKHLNILIHGFILTVFTFIAESFLAVWYLNSSHWIISAHNEGLKVSSHAADMQLTYHRFVVQLFSVLPSGLCPDWETWDPSQPVENAREAMQQADDWLGVPQVTFTCSLTFVLYLHCSTKTWWIYYLFNCCYKNSTTKTKHEGILQFFTSRVDWKFSKIRKITLSRVKKNLPNWLFRIILWTELQKYWSRLPTPKNLDNKTEDLFIQLPVQRHCFPAWRPLFQMHFSLLWRI